MHILHLNVSDHALNWIVARSTRCRSVSPYGHRWNEALAPPAHARV
jgi:hypothetical protein